jgi:hypothetical protein
VLRAVDVKANQAAPLSFEFACQTAVSSFFLSIGLRGVFLGGIEKAGAQTEIG